MASSMSSLCWTVCDRKLVSTRTEYGGRNAALYWKKSEDDTWGLRVVSGYFFQ